MLTKNGMLTEKSLSDFRDPEGRVKKAAYYDEDGFVVADKANKKKLSHPVKIKK